MQDASSPAAADAPRLREPRIAPAALARHLARAAQHPPPWLHEEIARRMDERLGLILRQPARLIDWWSPTSGGAPLLQARYPQTRLLRTGLDGRPLEDETRGEGRWWQRLLGAGRTRPSSENEAPAELLWANMMLHWIDDRPALLARWHELIAVDGFLMFSCFGPDTLAELRTIWAEAGWGAPGSDWVDMHDLGDDLVQAGFADPVMDMERLTLTWDSPQALLANCARSA